MDKIKNDILALPQILPQLHITISESKNLILDEPGLRPTVKICLTGGDMIIQHIKAHYFYIMLHEDGAEKNDYGYYHIEVTYEDAKCVIDKIVKIIEGSAYYGYDYNIVMPAIKKIAMP